MCSMMYDDQEKTQSPLSTRTGSGSKTTSSAGTPTQQPTSTQSLLHSSFDPGGLPSLDPKFVEQMMAEKAQPVRRWLDYNTEQLKLYSIVDLIQHVRGNVPEAGDLADEEIQLTIQKWAADRKITLPRLSVIPSDKPLILPSPPHSDSEILSSIQKAFKKVPTEIKVARPHGQVVIDVTGFTIKLRPGEQRSIGGFVQWGGKMGIQASSGNMTFEASLTKDEWNLKVAYTLGQSVPSLMDLTKIFEEGEQSLERVVDEITKGISSHKDISAIKEALSPHWDKVGSAIKAATQIAKDKPGKVSLSIQAGAKGPTFGGGPQVQPGVDIKLLLTFTW
jgi:hypothetical protein